MPIHRRKKGGDGETEEHAVARLIHNLLHALVVGFDSSLYRGIEVNTLESAVRKKIQLQILKSKPLKFLEEIGCARLRSGMRGVNCQTAIDLGKHRAVGRFQQNIAVSVLHPGAF